MIFTVLTSPDVPQATNVGSYGETLKARDYTFLADQNWRRKSIMKMVRSLTITMKLVHLHRSGADKHCDILPGMRHFGALATVVFQRQTVLWLADAG